MANASNPKIVVTRVINRLVSGCELPLRQGNNLNNGQPVIYVSDCLANLVLYPLRIGGCANVDAGKIAGMLCNREIDHRGCGLADVVDTRIRDHAYNLKMRGAIIGMRRELFADGVSAIQKALCKCLID